MSSVVICYLQSMPAPTLHIARCPTLLSGFIEWGTLSATNPLALVPDLRIRKIALSVLRSGTSATGCAAERLPH